MGCTLTYLVDNATVNTVYSLTADSERCEWDMVSVSQFMSVYVLDGIVQGTILRITNFTSLQQSCPIGA